MLQEGFSVQDQHSGLAGSRLERLLSVICPPACCLERSACRTDLIPFNQVMNEAKEL